jgi:hypothetical protein
VATTDYPTGAVFATGLQVNRQWPPNTMSIAVGDVNNDGRPDVVMGNYSAQNHVLLNNGSSPSNWPRVNLGSALTSAMSPTSASP